MATAFTREVWASNIQIGQRMIQKRLAEEFLAELEEIIQHFQAGSNAGAQENFALEDAVLRLRKLGFTSGQALKLLRRKPR